MDAILYHCTNAEKVKWKKKKILLLATIPKNQLLTRTITSGPMERMSQTINGDGKLLSCIYIDRDMSWCDTYAA